MNQQCTNWGTELTRDVFPRGKSRDMVAVVVDRIEAVGDRIEDLIECASRGIYCDRHTDCKPTTGR
jgi:hypothetical protein